jgi:putative hydrolase of the HAD superfamily
MVIRAVFFDVDDTLVDFAAASRPALEHVLGAKVDFEQWQNLPHYDRFVSGELDFDAMRALRMADFLATLGRHDEDPVGLEAARMAYLAASYTFNNAAPALLVGRQRTF